MKRFDKVRYIADHYGLNEQLAQTREELAELIVATSKFDRAKTSSDRIRATEQVTEEMADVAVMLMQLQYLLGNKLAVAFTIERKLDRQIQRIQDEQIGESVHE